jgi:hypothetical protein
MGLIVLDPSGTTHRSKTLAPVSIRCNPDVHSAGEPQKPNPSTTIRPQEDTEEIKIKTTTAEIAENAEGRREGFNLV